MSDFTDLVHSTTKPGREVVTPAALIPFRMKEEKARSTAAGWLKGLWFVPNKLKKSFLADTPLQRVYLPYWIFDTFAQTDYEARRGSVNHKGTVHNQFNEIFVPASNALPAGIEMGLRSYRLPDLVAYSEEYLSGVKSAQNSVAMADAFDLAKIEMQPTIDSTIQDDAGGDKCQILQKISSYSRVTSKYVLLPFWISSCSYQGNCQTFAINDCTGDALGDSPRSRIKIFAAAASSSAALICLLYFLFRNGLR